jgi:PAS domain-containing protein
MLAALMTLAGCDTLRSATPAAREARESKSQLQQLQARNMRFADDYVGRLIEASHRFEPSLGDARQRLMWSGWLLEQANAAYITASGDNPVVSTLDLLTLATLSRMVIEDTIAPRYPAQSAELVEAHRQLEAQAWQLASEVIEPAQQAALRNLYVEWRRQNSNVLSVSFVRFQDFTGIMRAQDSQADVKKYSGLLGVVGLDPLSGLDPAVRQLEQSRLLAERAIYYAQRVPFLFDLQLDRSLNRMAAGTETQKLLQQGGSLTLSAERFAAVAEGLPDAVAREREAFIRQLSGELEAQQASLRPLLLELRGTLEAGNATAASVDQAVRSLDALVARFSAKPASAGGPAPARPFDINEYRQAAEEITRAADQLQQLLDSVGGRAPQIASVVDSSLGKGRALVDYLVLRVAALIVLLLAGILATLLAYRWLAPRVRP